MSGQPVPSRENHRDSRDAKVRQIFSTAKEKKRKFSTVSAPIVDNFSAPSRKRLTHIYATKNQIPRYVMKHIFAHSRLFVLRLDKKSLPLLA
jgi:hypothetical protein